MLLSARQDADQFLMLVTIINFRFLKDFLPGKRALAIGLTVYHCIVSTVLFQAPRFVPYSLGALAEGSVSILSFMQRMELTILIRYKLTPEILWGGAHGFIGLGFVVWWQATVGITAAVRKMQ